MSGAEKYRTLVTEALKPLLSEAELARAVDAWAAAFAGKPALIPSMVAGHLAKTLGMGDKEAEIRTRLTQALLENHGVKSSTGDSKPAGDRPASGSGKPAARMADAASGDGSVVFRAMLGGIVDRLRAHLGPDAKGVESEWSALFKGKRLANATKQAIERWCQASSRGSNATLNEDITTEDMKTVVHAIYVWCCETLGPVEADRMFSDTVEEAAVLPEARRFAPTRLL